MKSEKFAKQFDEEVEYYDSSDEENKLNRKEVASLELIPEDSKENEQSFYQSFATKKQQKPKPNPT